MPIEDLRKLYTSPTHITNIPTSKQEEEEEEEEEELSTSEEDSSDQEDDSGYQRLLIAEHPSLSSTKKKIEINKKKNIWIYFISADNGDEEDIDGSSFSFSWQKVCTKKNLS